MLRYKRNPIGSQRKIHIQNLEIKAEERRDNVTLFREVSAAACVLGVIFSIISSLVPAEKFVPQIRMIFALILVLTIVPRIAGADISFDLPEYYGTAPQDSRAKVDRLLEEAIPQNICDNLEEIFKENGIYPREISVNINNSADGSIFITSAEIILPAEEDAEKARFIAEQALGTDKITVKAE